MGKTLITCLLIYTFIFFNIRWCRCNENSTNNNSIIKCKPFERAALFNFKHNLSDFDKDVSSSWEGAECCNWSRIHCDDTTGHILELDLYGDESNHLLKMEKLESLVYLLELRQLERLDLSNNDFSYSSIPLLMGSMEQLRYLYLSDACLGGFVPYELGNLTNLQILDLSNNMLSGEIPTTLGNLSKLKELDLNNNTLGGKLPTSIGKLSNLQRFDISSNPLEGTVSSETHFANLSSLTTLYMDETMLTLNLSSDWVPPFQLQSFSASNINGQLPPWLQTQKNLSYLDLFNANISGLMPRWFHTMQGTGRRNKGKGDNKEKLEKMGFGLVVMSGFATGFWGVVGGLVVNRRWRHAVFRRVEDGYNWLYVIVAVRVAKARRINRR